ncbi:hypothetical protein GQ44DRAFT_608228 [Phaeosphaeriaceae sp. PMI808]|nr:hypothetical protein GQ44DRAFT_608228 [Phaeosphaeriaceae sp. PMI808]
MASSQSHLGWNQFDRNAGVDTIDLTASSPEPEERPQTAQLQAMPNFKKESRNDLSHVKRVKVESNTPGMRARGIPSHARPIHPDHLAEIINTSNPYAIKSVLLDLCKLSPALSGAVARGLAPHSTFAQGLVRQHRQQVPARSIVKTEMNSDQAYERTKRRLLAERIAREGKRVQSPNTFGGAHRARLAGSQSVPRLKRERQPDLTDSDSDLSQYIPSSFPIQSRNVRPDHSPLRGVSGPSATNRTPRPFSLTERLRNVKQEHPPEIETKTCIQCSQTVENEHETCFYHPGSGLNNAGVLTCTECEEPLVELGCAIGMHVTE